MNIVVTGSLGFDYIMDFPGRFADRIMPDKIHKISLSFLVDKLNKNFGGTAGNIAYNLKLLGTNPFILATAGNDFAPYREYFKKLDISTEYIQEVSDVTTGSYFVVTDQEDNQIGSFYRGAVAYDGKLSLLSFRRLEGGEIPNGLSQDRGISLRPPANRDDKNISFVVIAPTEPAAMAGFVDQCQKQNLRYLYDPAFQIDNFSKQELINGISHAAILIGNDYEIELIEKKTGLAHEDLINLVPILITTLANKGSLVETKSKKYEIPPARPANTSDPTGAGDAYRAGFLAGFLRGFNLKTCGQMGSVAAVYTVEKYGTQTHSYSLEEFCKRYQENFDEKLKL